MLDYKQISNMYIYKTQTCSSLKTLQDEMYLWLKGGFNV